MTGDLLFPRNNGSRTQRGRDQSLSLSSVHIILAGTHAPSCLDLWLTIHCLPVFPFSLLLLSLLFGHTHILSLRVKFSKAACARALHNSIHTIFSLCYLPFPLSFPASSHWISSLRLTLLLSTLRYRLGMNYLITEIDESRKLRVRQISLLILLL